MQGVIGVVIPFAGAMIPQNWAACNGQALSAAQYPAVYALLGNTYGGNSTTFNLPDLRGRTPVSPGRSSVGPNTYGLGGIAGAESVTLTVNQLPSHNHNGAIAIQQLASYEDGIDPSAIDGYPSAFTGAYSPDTDSSQMVAPTYKDVVIGSTGGDLPIDTLSPFVVVNYIICLNGIFPSKG
jgi:microcystin-dependent protein